MLQARHIDLINASWGNCNWFCIYLTELENMAVQMTQMFCRNLPLSKDLDAQESMHGEELLPMACNVLVQVVVHIHWIVIIFIYVLQFKCPWLLCPLSRFFY